MKKNEKKVMVITTAFAGGGAEAVARTMVEKMEEASGVLFENNARIELPDRPVWVIAGRSNAGAISKILVNIWRLFVIQYLKFVKRPQVTVSHLEGPNFANLLTVLGGRRVIFVHNSVSQNYPQTKMPHRSKRALVRLSYNTADLICCVSADIRNDLVENYGISASKTRVFPNPIDCKRIVEQSLVGYGDSRDTLCRGNYVISVASLTSQKNHRLLISIFSLLVQDAMISSDLKLVLVGDGPEKKPLQHLCTRLGLSFSDLLEDEFDPSARVLFLRFQANPYPLLRHAQLLIMPSLWEGLPISLLEAMTLGVPSVVANCSVAIQDLMDPSVGQITELDSCGFVQTNYGILVKKIAPIDMSAVGLWSGIISDVLMNIGYRASCTKLAPVRAAEYDVERVNVLWREQILKEP